MKHNSTILVLGGAGFMGSNFIHFVLRKFSNIRVINVDALTYAGNLDNLIGVPKARHHFVKGDIGDMSLMVRQMKQADYVVNFAASTHVDRSIHESPEDFLHTNTHGVFTLLEVLRMSPRVKKMIQISTDEVWGSLELGSRKKFNELFPYRPNSPYAASKAAGDMFCRAFFKTYGVPVVVTHSVNNFGPRQFPEKLIPFFFLRAMQNKPLPLYGDGKNVRDWIHVDDHSAAIIALLEKGIFGEEYAIAGDDEYANREIAQLILNLLKKPSSMIRFVKDRPGHDRRYSVDARKIRKLGWHPKTNLEKSLPSVLTWYQENGDWLRSVLKKNQKINKHII